MSITRVWAGLWLSVLVGLAAAGTALGQVKDGKVDLRPRFSPGQTVRLKMEVSNNSTPVRAGVVRGKTDTAEGQPQATRSKIELGLTMKVKSVADNRESTVDLTFDTVKVSSKVGDESFDFDSSKTGGGDDDVMGLMMRSLVGQTLTLRVDRSGNISSVSGGEAFTALGQFVGGGGGGAGGMFGPIFSPQHGTGLVSIGETWENVDKLESPLMGKFKMTTRQTLRSVQGEEAKVAVTGRIEPDSEGSPGESFQVKESRYGGTYAWDLSVGMLKQMDTTMSVTMEHTIAGVKSTSRNESVMKVTRVR